jgi:ion channel
VIPKLLVGWSLMAVCVAVHASGISAAMRWLPQVRQASQTFLASTWLFSRVAAWIILLHLVEISVWGSFYVWQSAMPDLQSAVYFSAVTYTTTGYGDLVLPTEFRLIGGIEALTGILMCGWSTGFFFAVVSRVFTSADKRTS